MDAIERIREVISDKSLSLKDFSGDLGIQYRTIQRYMANDRSISADFLQALTDRMDVSASWILSGKGAVYIEPRPVGRQEIAGGPDFILIPRFDVAASAGHGAQVDSEAGTGYYAFNQKWLDRRGLTANSLSVISVLGDSMEPDLYENDLVLLDHAQTDLKDSHIYVMRFSDGLYVKRIQHLPEGQVHLISRNLAYPPITIKNPASAGVTIIGRVVASMHEW